MVQRKTSDQASKDYWASVDKLTRDVEQMPSWMKPKPAAPAADPSSGSNKPPASQKKP
jgi:hypothetical protein